MKIVRVYLAITFLAVLSYTIVVSGKAGWNLLPVFINDIGQLNWPGQFDFDFLCFLSFSGLWVAWRNRFKTSGIILGIMAFFGGTLFLAPYLIYLSFKCQGDIKKVLTGADI